MRAEITDAVWLEAEGEFSVAELAALCGIAEAQLRELVDYGALRPLNPAEPGWRFGSDCLDLLRRARRLRDELELDPFALSIMLQLMGRIRELEAELARLRVQNPRR